MILGEDKWLLFTGRHFWNRKCRKKTWWQQEFVTVHRWGFSELKISCDTGQEPRKTPFKTQHKGSCRCESKNTT